jgi:hypothetical protein
MGVPTARGGGVLRDAAELISIAELEKVLSGTKWYSRV